MHIAAVDRGERSYDSVRVENFVIDLVVAATGKSERVPIAAIDAVGWNGCGLNACFWFETSGDRRFAVEGLKPKDATELVTTIEQQAQDLAGDRDEQGRAVATQLNKWFAGTDYLRASQSQLIREQLDDLAGDSFPPSGALAWRYLSHESQDAFSRLRELVAESSFEDARRVANKRHVVRESQRAATAMAKVSGFQPIQEQASAVASDEDVTLVLAGAGTGKTAVITGKVAHLIANRTVSPEHILVLAFNRKAANELRKRLQVSHANVKVETFHSFARRVVALSDGAPTISTLAEDRQQMLRMIDHVLVSLLHDPERGHQLRQYILFHSGEYRAPHDFMQQSDYLEYIRRIELRTLNGEKVKSYEELKIANFLALHGVAYRYEAAFQVSTSTIAHGQYRPDFYLPEHEIYIEHFGVDQREEPPQNWSKSEREDYRHGMNWKRSIHAKHSTTLIETYSWQHQSGTWQPFLREQLEVLGVVLEPSPIEDHIQRLKQLMSSTYLSRLLASFLRHVKSGDFTDAELRQRASAAPDPGRAHAFLDLFREVNVAYRNALTGEYDFDELINDATRLVRETRGDSAYRYILVDEFQDVSRGRMKLLAALNRPETAYFLVGDDWQSINRFAGSDVGLLCQAEDWLGQVETRQLNQTFRFGAEILLPSSRFVQRNRGQTSRVLRPFDRRPDHGLTVVWHRDVRQGVQLIADDLAAREVNHHASILVLGRYRRRFDMKQLDGRNAEFSIVHAAKGREADYVVVLDLKDQRRGFPSQMDDDPLLDLVSPLAEPFEFAEERRLLYVAVTRARHGVYLLTDPLHPSPFVTELLEDSGSGLRSIGEAASYVSRHHLAGSSN